MKLKNTITFIFAVAVLVLATGIDTNAQSAKMKSLMREINEQIPKFEKEVSEKCDGAKFKYEVDFASFGDNYEALLRVPSQGLNVTTSGIKRFCTDSNNTSKFDPDKAGAFKSKVKVVKLQHVATKESRKIEIQTDGTLLIAQPYHDLSGCYGFTNIADILGDIL